MTASGEGQWWVDHLKANAASFVLIKFGLDTGFKKDEQIKPLFLFREASIKETNQSFKHKVKYKINIVKQFYYSKTCVCASE